MRRLIARLYGEEKKDTDQKRESRGVWVAYSTGFYQVIGGTVKGTCPTKMGENLKAVKKNK